MAPRTLALALLSVALLAPMSAAHARCAPLSLAQELRQSLYVFEGTVASADADGTVTFVVDAVWQGQPGARVRVRSSGRSRFSAYARPGETYLVFALGTDAESLYVARCGNTGPLAGSTAVVDQLRARGMTRTAPWHAPVDR